jgi:hypothetical protein
MQAMQAIINKYNHEKKYKLTGHVLDLFFKDQQFEFYKPQGHWRLTWLLTSGPVGLVEVCASWPGHPY